MTTLQAIAIIVGLAISIGGAIFAVARVVFVTEVRVEQAREDIKSVKAHIVEVEKTAEATDKEVTGPHSVNQMRLEGQLEKLAMQVASLDKKIDQLINRGRS